MNSCINTPSKTQKISTTNQISNEKKIISPQPLKKRSSIEGRLFSNNQRIFASNLNFDEKKTNSLMSISIESFNSLGSLHIISSFSNIEENDLGEHHDFFIDELSLISQIRKESSNPHFKDPNFGKDADECSIDIDIDVIEEEI